ncbi:MAG: hypothetical protein H6R13_2883 [Proteobacteria bacterium]|nr:hypothetical protein [Pseudomonadota bacterium]
MKALVFLLVLANLLFYAFGAGYFGRLDNPDAGRVEHQVMPERMRIVSRGEAPAAPVKAAEPAREVAPNPAPAEAAPPEVAKEEVAKLAEVPPVCLAWDHLSVAEADRLSELAANKFKDFKIARRVVAAEGNGWWVHIPPQASKAEVDKKAGELRDLEVTDFFVVQEGANRFAISLGVFSSEKGAQDRLAELKVKGVRSARVAPRPGKDSTVKLLATGPAADKKGLIAAAGKIAPKAEALLCK